MRRPSKDSSHKLSAESQRLVTYAQAVGQAASRIEERAWEHSLDAQLQKLLKTGHQDTLDATLNALFKEDLTAYDVLMDGVEAASESSSISLEVDGETKQYDVLLVAAPVLAWTRFSIASGTIPNDILTTLSAHFSAHLLAEGAHGDVADLVLDRPAAAHPRRNLCADPQAGPGRAQEGRRRQAGAARPGHLAIPGRHALPAGGRGGPAGAPLFRWQEPQHQASISRPSASRPRAMARPGRPNIGRLLPGCGVELLLPEAYYVACREADKLIRPVSIRAAVHYLTNTLGVEPNDLRAVIAGFGDEANDSQIDEYRVGFTLRSSSDVMYGIVWPLYGQEDEEGTPAGRSTQVPGRRWRRSRRSASTCTKSASPT
jgi:hypothetical protein